MVIFNSYVKLPEGKWQMPWDDTVTHMRTMVLEYAHQHVPKGPKSPSFVGKYTSTIEQKW